jgi:hypothetical protein
VPKGPLGLVQGKIKKGRHLLFFLIQNGKKGRIILVLKNYREGKIKK